MGVGRVMRLLKCYGEKCVEKEIKHPAEDLFKDGGKNYCRECLNIKKQNQEERRQLNTYVSKVFDIPYPTPHMTKQISNFKDQYGISFKEQMLTVNYFVNALDKIPDIKFGLAFIVTYHQAALVALEELRIQREAMKKVQEEEIYVDVVTVKGATRKIDDLQEIDMNDLI